MTIRICIHFIPLARRIITLITFIFTSTWANSQQTAIDSLKKLLTLTAVDTVKIVLLNRIGQEYINTAKVDSSIFFYQQGLELIKRNNLPLIREIWQLASLSYVTSITGNYTLSMEYANRALLLSERTNNNQQIAFALANIAAAHAGMGDLRKSLSYYFKSKKAFEKYESGHWAIQNIAETYLKMHMLDSALYFNRIAYFIGDTGHNQQYMKDFAIRIYADIYAEKGEDQLALKYFRQFIEDFYRHNLNNREIAHTYFGMAKLYHRRKEIDSSIFYADKALTTAQIYADEEHIFNASKLLYLLYDSLHNESKSFKYFKIAAAARDSLVSLEKIRQIQILSFNEQLREKQQESIEARESNRIRLIITIGSIFILILSFLLWNRMRQLRSKHEMILEQKEAEKLKMIDKLKDRFFSNITHELRTPLSLILSPVELYLQHPERLKDPSVLFHSIYKNSSYLLSLINQLLDISKLDGGSMSIKLSQGYFGKYINELTESFEENAGRKQIALHFENNVYGKYLFDGEHWNKIINNLLSNAIKFTLAGGDIFVSVDKIAGMDGRDVLRLTVRDTGIGIHKDHLPFITDRFYQADNSFKRKYEGAGIGLALLSELVKLMGGKLEINSEESKGSVFIITATFESAEGKNSYPELTNLRTSILVSNLHPARDNEISKENIPVILIVEDNPELRDFMQTSLEPMYKVITAAHGEEGLQVATSQFPDIIISDVMMPVMDGFEFCSRVKNNPSTSHIAFIIVSAKAAYLSKMAGLEKGADDYLTKPFSVDELLSRIKNNLNRQKKLRDHNLRELLSENPLAAARAAQNEFLLNIYKNIEDNLEDEHLTAEFLAAKMVLSEGTLDRQLIANIGLSANELIKQYHLKRTEMQKKMFELEATALRAQMNPHFIFNSLNSIKSLINKNENDKAAGYLTTFSKLIRTLFQNADKREVSLFEEIETCKLYTQLERMRFGDKVDFIFHVDETIDTKDIKMPALILQPFIENAIWHGLVPKETGGRVFISVKENQGAVQCIIDDDGIGRELSKQYKTSYEASHQSKGIAMTHSRLELDKLLNEREDSIQIIDKKNEVGTAEGTTIIITFKEIKN
jgi:signal transduction histidine kinase